MIRKILFSLLTLASLWQLFQEVIVIQYANSSGSSVSVLFQLLALLVIVSGIPLIVLAYLFSKRHTLRFSWFWLSVLFGCFVIGQPAGLLNYSISTLLNQLFPNNAFVTVWQASIVPPLVEEALKLGLSLTILYLCQKKDFWHGLLIGGGVGLGFQLSEDYTYVLGEILDQKVEPLSQALLRLETAFASHWLLTAIFTGAICLILFYEGKKKKVTYLWLIAPILLHVAWNSPFIENNTLFKVLLTITCWLILGSFYIYGYKMIHTNSSVVIMDK